MAEKTLPAGVAIVDTNEISSLVPNFTLHVGDLGRARRGDFVRLLLKFSEPAQEGREANSKATEFVTCVVTSRTPGGLLKAKVYSRPEKTLFHSVDHGDELTLGDRYVLSHEISTDQILAKVEPFLSGQKPKVVPLNIEDAKLRAAVDKLPAIPPQQGGIYWLRNGAVVRVWTWQTRKQVTCQACGRQLLGANIQNEMCPNTRGYHSWVEADYSVWLGGSDDGAAIEWTQDGSHAGGLRDLDIVKDPTRSSEVVA